MKISYEQLPTSEKLKISLKGKAEWVGVVKLPHYRRTYRPLPVTGFKF